jgi:putative ABC transport system substrate-binding protein
MIRFIGILLIFMLGAISSANAAENDARLLILYPKLNAAYDRVFAEIVSGASSHKGVIVRSMALTESVSRDEIQEEIDTDHIDSVIALGQSSYAISQQFSNQLPVIHGGMLMTPNGQSGISLAGSPAQFFSHLRHIAPPVKRVFTVYSEENSGWLIKLAQQEAKKYNIELTALPAKDIRDAVYRFREILDQVNGPTDAIWLLLDKLLPDQTILPMVLEAAWKRNVVLFSNNPSHTRRGALFALFPDHYKMGYSLADLSLHQLKSKQPTLLPLSSLKVSVNERTASHLGLRYSSDQLEHFDVIYPLR